MLDTVCEKYVGIKWFGFRGFCVVMHNVLHNDAKWISDFPISRMRMCNMVFDLRLINGMELNRHA